jgi:hypothetical protein
VHVDVDSRSTEFNAWPTMNVPLLHKEAITSFYATRFTDASVADLTTDAFRVGRSCH